jgi:hypothetical protein
MPFDRSLIDKYEAGAEHLAQAISGLTYEDLIAPPPNEPGLGKWTIQQVVIHLMDSELIAIDRMKRLISMENPLLVGYDENLFMQHLMPHQQSAEDAVTILKLAFKNFAPVLRALPDEAFSRKGTHNERGPVTLGQYLESMVKHMANHLKFIHAKRAAMGKEMW